MLSYLGQTGWAVDVVTCVPLSKGRLRERGYNQAALLARPLALGSCLPFFPLLLRKTREVPSQVGLTALERKRNVVDAFLADGQAQNLKRILVVDDVTTTGSTLEACARALLDAGAREVYGLTFARAGLHDHNFIPKLEPTSGGSNGSQSRHLP
jgi:ComF family protein